ALEYMCKRVRERTAFGSPIAEHGVVQNWIAESRTEIEQARLLTLKLSSTCPAGIYPCSICIPVLAGKWWFGAGFSKNFKSFGAYMFLLLLLCQLTNIIQGNCLVRHIV